MITTAREMYIATLHGIQKEDAEGIPAEKFNFWINKAQEDWLAERAKEMDLEQKRIDDLALLYTKRLININGTRTVTCPADLRIFSDGSGTFIVDPERYFSLSGLTFYASDGATGVIDSVTGAVTGAILTDVFYALVYYSELPDFPVLNKVTVSGTLASTHVGALLTTHETYTAAVADVASLTNYWGTEISGSGTVSFLDTVDYRFLIPNGYPNPKYFRLLNVQFKITYVDNPTFPDGVSSWLESTLMRADQKIDIYKNAYRYPTDEKPYHRILGEFMEFISETDSTPLYMNIEYLRYPREIKYVEPESDDVAVDCELPHVQQKEIVDMAVRMYIEATQSPRYQTQIAEDQIKDKGE